MNERQVAPLGRTRGPFFPGGPGAFFRTPRNESSRGLRRSSDALLVAPLGRTKSGFCQAVFDTQEAIERIKGLYAVEKHCTKAGLSDAERQAVRQKESLPLLDELFAWMALKEAEVLPKSPMAGALRYSLKLEDALRRYATDGRLEIDNNRAERALRQVAVGRKNWMFFLTEGGGESAVVLLSLVMTAKAIGLNPQTYLRDVLLRIARERYASGQPIWLDS